MVFLLNFFSVFNIKFKRISTETTVLKCFNITLFISKICFQELACTKCKSDVNPNSIFKVSKNKFSSI